MKIKDIGKVITGKTPSTKKIDNFEGTIKFITPEDIAKGYIVKTTNRHISEKGYESIKANTLDGICVLVGCIGSDMGNVAISEGRCASNQQINAITNIADAWNPFYVYYYLSQKKQYFHQMAGSTTTPILPKSVFEEIDIPYIDKKIQDKIVNILKILDDKIDNNNEIIEELELMAKTIYDYWFLQYEFPNVYGRPYKSSGGKMVWNEELKIEIPENWQNGMLEDVGEIVAGGTPSTEHSEYYCKNGIAWITPNDLSNSSDKYITHGERDISEIGLINSSAKLMPKGAVLLTSRAPIGYIGIAINEVCTNQGFKSIVPNKKFGSEFIYYTIQKMIEYLKSLGTGSTFTEISKNVVAKVKIVLPEETIVKNFETITSEISSKRRILEEENRELKSLRDFLLPLLMNGQVGFN